MDKLQQEPWKTILPRPTQGAKANNPISANTGYEREG